MDLAAFFRKGGQEKGGTEEEEEEEEEEDEIEEEGKEEIKEKETMLKPKAKKPNSTLKRFAIYALPTFCFHFLFGTTKDFPVTKFFLGVGFGGFIGIGIYYLLVDPMSLYEDQKINLLYGTTGSFALGWGLSTYFRCTTLIIAPNVLGKEGRAYLVIFVIGTIYTGPVMNLQHNLDQIVKSIGCTVELQINHTQLIWKIMTNPLKKIVEDLVTGGKEMKSDSQNIMSEFEEMDSEVKSTEGYNQKIEKEQKEEVKANNKTLSTQRIVDLKTKLRCQYIIETGIDRCHDWFDKKHAECMRVLWLPVFNHILCLPMKFKFLCNILYLINPWCKKKLPVEGNFGQTYDKVNGTMNNMDNGFSTGMSVKRDDQEMFVGMNISELLITEEVLENISKRKVIMMKVVSFIKVILSCTFVYLFISAYNYCNKYNTNIRFDNVYVTTYFKQIDARRKKRKKSHLLPLRKGEYINFVFPFKLRIQGPEIKPVMLQLLQCIPILTALIVVIIIDLILYHMFQIVRKHAYISYVFSSRHKLNILVGGNTLLARILRSTIGALNTSSNMILPSNNTICLPDPVRMSLQDYVLTCLPMAGYIVLSVVQVYMYRLRRAIAAYFFPKREKRRVLFLYNQYLRKRAAYVDIKRKMIMRKARANRLMVRGMMGGVYRHCTWMRKLLRRRCMVCNESETRESHVCQTPDCGTVYCRQCWRDMKRYCFACMPYDDFISADSDSDYDDDDDD